MDAYEAVDYLLKHFSEIKEDLKNIAVSSETNPILHSHLKDAMVSEVVQAVAQGTHSSYEDVSSVLSAQELDGLLGLDWWKI